MYMCLSRIVILMHMYIHECVYICINCYHLVKLRCNQGYKEFILHFKIA